MGRMDPPQKFFSFSETKSSDAGKTVGLIALLRVTTIPWSNNVHSELSSNIVNLPTLMVRMVPGQIDDLLIGAEDLDLLGFDATYSRDLFHLKRVDVFIPRETPSSYPEARFRRAQEGGEA